MEPITREQFDRLINSMKFNVPVDFDFIYDVYCVCFDGLKNMKNEHMDIPVNSYELVNYCIGEYIYTTTLLSPEAIKQLKNDEMSISSMASISLDKYITLSLFNSKEPGIMNKFLPPISSINTYLNFMLNILNSYNEVTAENKLIKDLLIKAASISRCILNLLVGGYTTEAFGVWRTLHECECVLVLLDKYKNILVKEYLKFMNYGIAYQNGNNDREKYQSLFDEIKTNMAKHDLKSKDIKKYIEYGWLYAIPGVEENEPLKLNFKDGLEKVSGLSQYGNRFSTASEIVHSTPLLLYPNKNYFYYLTLLSVYESFFRLEKAFTKLFNPIVDENSKVNYLRMKNVYYKQIQNIYKRELNNFLKITNKQ